MSDPDEVTKVAPSASTVATGSGGAAAVILVWALGLKGIVVPPEVAAAITWLMGTLTGYLPKSGRS